MVGQLWKVVGGGSSGGILVRVGQKLSAAEIPERMKRGTVVEELELIGERLHFSRRSGSGPATGWVSIKSKGADLLIRKPLSVPPKRGQLPESGGPGDFGDKLAAVPGMDKLEHNAWCDAMGQPDLDGNESPHKDDPEWKFELKREFKREYEESVTRVGDSLGAWRTLVRAKNLETSDGAGPSMHICCLCLAETGHLTPLLRVARGVASLSTVRRVSFISNSFGAGKVAKWLESDPDEAGKIAVLAFEDAWTEVLQDRCNWFAQAEDGSLMGISNVGISKHAVSCLQAMVAGEDPAECILLDCASQGYLPILTSHEVFASVPIVSNCSFTILAGCVFDSPYTTLVHCFNSPMFESMLAGITYFMKKGDKGSPEEYMELMTKIMLKDPSVSALHPNMIPVGIIADVEKLGTFDEPLQSFLDRPGGGPVVYVSMGSVSNLNPEQVQNFAIALKAPGEWRVIWSLKQKQQEMLPGGVKSLGEDFYVSSWLPQAKLLLHKNVAVFVSHCGWGATCEAILSATPVVAVPWFADQFPNAAFMEGLGMAKMLGKDVLTFASMAMDPTASQKFMERVQPGPHGPSSGFTADSLNEDIRLVLKQKKFTAAAKQVRAMNTAFKGGAKKAAKEVENVCKGLHPDLPWPAT